MRRNLIAAIDVGSHAIRMKIGEINRAGNFKELERFRKIAMLGHDTFTTGKVSFESVDKICVILGNFKKTMNDYGVRHYTAMATSAIREAENRDYILDQIKIKTGIGVQVIDNTQEQYLTHKAIRYNLSNYDKLIDEGVIVIVIGAGSIQVTTYMDGELKSSQNVKMGALRIKEILGNMKNSVIKYNNILEEYIRVNMEGLVVGARHEDYKHLVVVGGEMSVLSQMVELDVNSHRAMKKKELSKVYHMLLQMDIEEIRYKYGIKKEQADIIQPSLMLLDYFAEMTSSKEVIVPSVSLVDGIVRHIHENLYNLRLDEAVTRDVITNATMLAEQFGYNKTHCRYVEEIALQLFDKLKKVHGMKLERQHLRVAAILHDIGKFISLDQHSHHSYELIRSLELFGMSSTDMEVIALVAKFHGMIAPTDTRKDFSYLNMDRRLVTAKLIAILRLADGMDRGHGQKIDIKSIKIKDKVLTIKGTSKVDTTLEEWNFGLKAIYFQDVFGIEPVLRISKEV